MRITKYIFLILTMVFIFSLNTFAYDPEYSNYDPEVLEKKVEAFVPTGFGIEWLEVEQLALPSEDEYVILQVIDRIFISSSDEGCISQVFVLKPVGDDFQIVGSTDVFPGYVKTLELADTDNDRKMEINLVITQDGHNTYQLKILKWNGTALVQIYPQDGFPYLSTDGGFDFIGPRGNTEIIVGDNIKQTDTEIVRNHYRIQDGKMQLTNKEVISLNKPTLQEPNNFDEQYPSIAKVVGENTSGTIEQVDKFYIDDLFLVKITTTTTEEPCYLVVKEVGDVARLLYKLPKEYNSLDVDIDQADDLNNDGYIELPLVDGLTENGLYNYYYILTLTPSEAILVSPVYDDDVLPTGLNSSLLGTTIFFGQPVIEDIDEDGLLEIGTSVDYKDQDATQYWHWQNGVYVAYKIKYFDTSTNQIELIDNSSIPYENE